VLAASDKTFSPRRRLAFAAAALLLACSARAGFFSLRPRWTRAKPHFERRDGRLIAVAAGTAKDANPSLARAAAEDRARAGLLLLLQGKPPDADAQGWVRGAKLVDVYKAGRGRVYVRLELDAAGLKATSGSR
jgi:hypothetical protein